MTGPDPTDEPKTEVKDEEETEQKPPKSEKAKNKITKEESDPAKKSRFAHLLKEEKDDTSDEEVNVDYMNMLHKSFLAEEKDRERNLLALPSFKHSTIQQEPPEIVALFEDYAEATSEEKIQRWKRIKQEQKDYLASWKLSYTSEKLKE